MKINVHPKYYPQAKVVCACGNSFTVGSTLENIRVDLCYNCHPFYTGEQKFVDTASLIQKFQAKQQKAQQYKVTAKKKVEVKKQSNAAPKTLTEMLSALK